MALQIRRGTNANRANITPLSGELIFTTDTQQLYVGDGVTPGGILITGSSVTPGGANNDVQFNSGGAFVGSNAFAFNPTSNTLTITGNTVTTSLLVSQLANLGSVANVKISGGANGQVLTTDGLGNLVFANAAANVTPGGTNTAVQFNSNGTLGGDTNFTYDSANASNGLRVISSFTANPGAHIIEVKGLNTFMGSVADGGVGVANATTTINTPATNITSPGITLGNSSGPGTSYVTVNSSGVSLGQAGGQVISAGSSGINIGGTGGVTIQGVANANVTLGGSTGGNIDVVNPINLGPIANVHITGGNAGQVLTTDGAGTLSFANAPAAGAAGANTQLQFNANGAFGASANLTWDGNVLYANSIYSPANISGRGDIQTLDIANRIMAQLSSDVTGSLYSGFLQLRTVDQGNANATATVGIGIPVTSNFAASGGYALTLPANAGSNGQFLQTDGTGNLSFANVPQQATVLQKEFHVSPSGNNTTGDGTQSSPYLTIGQAITAAGNGNAKVILHVGGYNEDVTISEFNISLTAAQTDGGGLARILGNLNISGNATSTRLQGITANVLNISNGTVYGDQVTVLQQLNKTGSGYTEFTNSDLQVAGNVSLSSGATSTTVIDGTKIANLRVGTNSVVIAKNTIAMANTIVDGGALNTLGVTLTSLSAGANALATTANGGIVSLKATNVVNPDGSDGRISIGASLYRIDDLNYDAANSTLGTPVPLTTYFQTVNTSNVTTTAATLGNVANVKVFGGTAGQVLTTDGTGNLSWTTVSNGGGGGGSIIFSSAAWQPGNAAASDAYFWDGAATATNEKSITANYIIAGNANSATFLTFNGVPVSNVAQVTVSSTSLSVPASIIPANVQTDTSTITMVVKLSNGTTETLGSTTLTPTLLGTNPFTLSGPVTETVTNPAAIPFWGSNGTGNIAAGGQTVTGGALANVTYTLFDGGNVAIANSGVQTSLGYTFSNVAVGTGYTVQSAVNGTGSRGAAPTASNTTTSGAVAIVQNTYTPLFYGTSANSTPVVFTTSDTYVPQQFVSGQSVTLPSIPSTSYYWVATPTTSSRVFTVTTGLGNAVLTPDVDAGTVTIGGENYHEYGFTNVPAGFTMYIQ